MDRASLLSQIREYISDGDQTLQAYQVAALLNLVNGQNPTYELQVQRGLIPGVTRQVIFGHNVDIDVATVPEDIWESGGLYPFQSSAQSLEILSSSAADTAAGTGARTAEVKGLDSNWIEQSELVTLNGATPRVLTLQYLRVNGCEIKTAGTGQTNSGQITLRVAGGGATQALIDTGDGRAMQAIYTVPANKALHFISREMMLLRQTVNTTAEIFVNIRNVPAGLPWIVRNIVGLQNTGTSSYVKDLPFLVVPAKSDFRATVVNVGANDCNVAVTFEALLIDN